jgi:AraC-like DNA-binding protein
VLDKDEARTASSGQAGDNRTEMVRIEALGFFEEAVLDCGGNPEELLRTFGLTSAILHQRNSMVPYRQMMALFNHAARTLKCPDFGLNLAKRQRAIGVLGPLDIAMRNSETLEDAFRYCAEHVHAYCTGTRFALSNDPDEGRWILRFEILLDRTPKQSQTVEHALLVTHYNILAMSEARARTREIWFTHEPVSPLATYRQYFGAPVYFAQPYNAIVLDAADKAIPIVGRSEQLYELATNFIDAQFPSPESLISTKVRSLLSVDFAMNYRDAAAALGMHPRTLQRRLREEGARLDTIKDEVRREAAFRYLRQTRTPLIKIATMLGYSELSAFSRSCQRWFHRSPLQLRQRNAAEPGLAGDPADEAGFLPPL